MKIKRIIILCAAAAVLWFAGVQAFNFFYYRMYKGYEKYLTGYETNAPSEITFGDGADVPGMRLVSESENLKLYTDTATAEVAVFDKRNGVITYSNPPDADNDPLATAVNKSYLKSQLILEYYSSNRNHATFNSWDDAVSLEQFEYAGIENGIRYTYTFGDFTSETGIVPLYLSPERMAELTSRMTEVIGERQSQDFESRFRDWADREGYFELIEGARRSATIRKLTGYLEEIGYTSDDFALDMTGAGVEGAVPVSFVVSVDYVLSEDRLNVSVPMNLIQEDGGAMLTRIQLLRYFGAGGAEEDGYMLLPNGSGSLLRFNNGKTGAPNYSQFVYGIDLLISDYVTAELSQPARLPVFGISRTGSAVFAEIVSGDSLASISAYVSGNMNSYNFVYPTFITRSGERMTMFGATDMSADLPIVEENYYDVLNSVNYYFLAGEDTGYSGMANFYREKLAGEGVLTKRQPTDSIPFFMDIEGGAQGTGFFLGAKYSQTIAMTTFEQAREISGELFQSGVQNQYVNYQGWFNKGYYHDAADKIKIIGKLGGKPKLEDLTAFVEGNGGKVFGEAAFQKVSWAAGNYEYAQESSRYYGAGFTATFGQVNPVENMQTSSMGYREILFNLISPKFLDRYVGKFADKVADIGITGVTLRDLGDQLHSDKKRTEVISREAAKDVVTAQMEKLDATGKNLMFSGGNAYALQYADSLINVPISHNAFFLLDEEVPFYEMVVHGYLDYAGESINLTTTDSPADVALRLIAAGASPHYTFTYESASLLKKTGLNHYHSTTYANWKNDAAEVYGMVNEALKNVSGCAMVKHEILTPSVTSTHYDNGVVITVNNSSADVEINGHTLKAKSYAEGIGE